IKAQEHRSQLKNKEDAISRLKQLIKSAVVIKKKRKPTKPSTSSQKRRVDAKKKRSQIKSGRKQVSDE
ncbi:MAG: aminoacyl-tRNA hydrolase, partial [Nostocales cyanobacterium 94392]|nr:aminoacyl-tRNA hydrolase [Nostocales cyanobacterium 94392]